MDHREPITIESRAHRPGTPGWARLVGAAIVVGLLGLIGWQWTFGILVPVLVVAIIWYRVKTGHWPD